MLLRFLVISFADLKKWSFHYWFAFPALVLDPPATLVNLKPASQCFTSVEVLFSRMICYFIHSHFRCNYLKLVVLVNRLNLCLVLVMSGVARAPQQVKS